MVSVMDLSLSLFKDLIPAENKSVRSIGTQAGGLRQDFEMSTLERRLDLL